MSTITSRLLSILETIPKEVCLVAVSKTKPMESILEAYNAGQRVFGENKVQEMVEKQAVLPKDISWHMIGHLQRNKVKYMAPFVALIHGVDSLKTLLEIQKQAKKNQRIIDCLLQVHIASETHKFGFSFEEIHALLDNPLLQELDHIRITGLMGMATFTKDTTQITIEFTALQQLFEAVKSNTLDTLSMGMSGDYPLAIAQGSTMVRVGSAIFGERNYKQ